MKFIEVGGIMINLENVCQAYQSQLFGVKRVAIEFIGGRIITLDITLSEFREMLF